MKRALALAMFALALIPPLVLALFVWRHAVDVPVYDQFEMAPIFDHYYSGQLQFAELWQPHEMHRLLIPKTLMLLLGLATHWNIRWEMALTFLFAACLFAVFTWMVRRRVRSIGWELPVAAAIIFSLAQQQNWLWGWQLQIMLSVLATVAALALADGCRRWGRLAGAALLATVASYSFADGLITWPVGLALILLSRHRRKAAAWSVAGAIVIAFYLHDLPKTPLHFEPGDIYFRQYLLAYLGATLDDADVARAIHFGELGLVLAVALSAVVIRLRGLRAAVFPLALVSYALGSDLAAALGRSTLGPRQALSSRYITPSMTLWLAILQLLSLALEGRRWWTARVLAALGGAALLWQLVLNEKFAARERTRFEHGLLACRRSLLENAHDRCWRPPNFYSELVLSQAREILVRRKLSLFR